MAAAKKAESRAPMIVTAPLVAAKVGKQVLHFYEGDVLPEGTDPASVENLRSLGFLSEGDAPAEADEK